MKILLVDDHLLFLEGLRSILRKLPFTVDVISANNIEDAEYMLGHHNIDDIGLALIDLNFPKKGGLYFIRMLQAKQFIIPTIILSAEENITRIKQGLDAGAHGFIPKSLSGDEMIAAILQVLDGNDYIPNFLSHGISSAIAFGFLNQKKKRTGRGVVSKRQYETLLLIAEGLSNKVIADRLCLSEHTVKSHTSTLLRLLDAKNRTECVLRAKKIGIIE